MHRLRGGFDNSDAEASAADAEAVQELVGYRTPTADPSALLKWLEEDDPEDGVLGVTQEMKDAFDRTVAEFDEEMKAEGIHNWRELIREGRERDCFISSFEGIAQPGSDAPLESKQQTPAQGDKALDPSGLSKLMRAAREGELSDILSALNGTDVTVNQADPSFSRFRAVHWAALSGKTRSLRLLLRLGADVDARSEEGQRALHIAVLGDQRRAASLLLKHGADVNARDKEGSSPLHVAAAAGSEEYTAYPAMPSYTNSGTDRDFAWYQMLQAATEQGS